MIRGFLLSVILFLVDYTYLSNPKKVLINGTLPTLPEDFVLENKKAEI
ncbi:hypothetical protein HNP25_004389 [Arcicella rosea]|uniref:Uncharacterized protein n=1 Tax=Arcicella rosea TaxID=502909 RepID=A0A841EZD5_9BACT|nr:hypothetical protein [Arcicella rosea]